MAMASFHDVNIYRGTVLVTTSTRLEVAARSPFLQQLLTSIRTCDGCKEPTTLIFPAEYETKNILLEMFKSRISPDPVIYDTGDIIINDIRSTVEIESFESLYEGDNIDQIIRQNTTSITTEDEADLRSIGGPSFHMEDSGGGGERFNVVRKKKPVFCNQIEECSICHKQFKTKKYLGSHLALCHYKKELKPFIDEDLLQCKICHSQHSNIYNLRVHVASAHKKLEEVMQQTTKSSNPKQTGYGYRQYLQQLDHDLNLSSDGDPEISQGDEMDHLFSDPDEVQWLEF